MHHDILALDIAGTPVRWIGPETAAMYYASGKIAWELGDAPIHLRGGINVSVAKSPFLTTGIF